MKACQILTVLFLTFSALANCPDKIVLESIKGKVSFCQTSEGLVISENCYVDKTCNWTEEITKIQKITPSEDQLVGGKNPDSVKCSLAGKVVHLFRDQKKNEQTFCEIMPGKFLDVNAFSN